MSTSVRERFRHRGSTGRRKDQRGGEVVEFAIFASVFFLMIFAIIDMSFAVFNQGITNQAARYGARQGTLYWVDPARYNPSNPMGNIRVREQFIVSGVDYYGGKTLLNFSGVPITKDTIELPGANSPSGSAPNREWTNVSNARVTVRLEYPHNFLVLNALAGLLDVTMDADTRLSTESD
jgi:hypothetical protein